MDPESSTISETSLAQTATQAAPSDDSSSPLVSGEEPELGSDTATPETTQDAQSTVLGYEDLLRLIFSFHTVNPLRDWGSTSQFSPFRSNTSGNENVVVSRDLLLKASLTCKAFFYPAVCALWQSIDSIVPLVKLISGVVKQGSVWTTTTAISEEDLQRFDFYAQLVRRLEVSAEALRDESKDGCVATHVLPFVQDYRPQGLLPSLKVLEITEFRRLRPDDVWLLKSMVPSAGTLSQFIIKGIPSPSTNDTNVTNGEVLAASILKSIHIKSPRLTTIALDDYQDEAIFNVLKDVESLQSISLDFSASHLQRLTQSQNPRSAWDSEPPFNNVVNLHLTGSVSSVHLVIGAIFPHTPRLKNLKISLITQSRNRIRRDAFKILVNRITEREGMFLESLMIDHHHFNSTFQWAPLRYFTRPICKELKALSIPVPDLSMEDFATMFPVPHRSLVWLEIDSGFLDIVSVPEFDRSLNILILVHDMIPNLKYLQMPIFFSTESDDFKFIGKRSNGTFTCHGLEELRLKSFRNGDPLSNQPKNTYPKSHLPSQKFADLLVIARYFDDLFPHLTKIDTGELRQFVEERWLDGLEAAVKQFAEQRISLKGCCEGCGK